MTVDNIFTTRFARNPLISRVLTEMELVRELNEGVPRIFEEMKAAGLPEPKIVETTANVTVVLYNGKTAANNAQTTENTTQKTTEKIIRILKERPYATAGQLAEELGLTIDGADYNIRKLKKQGRIFRIGKKVIRYLSQSHDLLRDSPEVCRLLVRKAAIDRGQ